MFFNMLNIETLPFLNFIFCVQVYADYKLTVVLVNHHLTYKVGTKMRTIRIRESRDSYKY